MCWKEFVGTNGHGNKNHCGHCNHGINYEQQKKVVDSRLVITLLDGGHQIIWYKFLWQSNICKSY
jgi:hypothetical protein